MQFDRDIVDFFMKSNLYWHFKNDECQFSWIFLKSIFYLFFHSDKLSRGGGDADTVHKSGLSGKCLFIQ